MSYCDSEEEFLSVYTCAKLIKGGKPVITTEELESAARDEDSLSDYFADYVIKSLAKLKFDDLQNIKPYDSKKKKNLITLSFIASLLIAISGAIFLYIAIMDEDLNVELAFN